MFDLEPHDFDFRNGVWVCDTEGVVSEECTDLDRCSSQCVCNVPEGMRECDDCGRLTDAGAFPDWVNGVCEDCDPEILNHPDNLARMV